MPLFHKKEKKQIQNLSKSANGVARSGRTSEACNILKTSLEIAEGMYSNPSQIEILRIKEGMADMNYRGKHYDEALEIYSSIMSYWYEEHAKFFDIIRYKEEATIEKILRRTTNHRPKILEVKVKDLIKEAENFIDESEYTQARFTLLDAERSTKMCYDIDNDRYTKIKELMTDITHKSENMKKEKKISKIRRILKQKTSWFRD